MRARTITGRPGRNIALTMLVVATLVVSSVALWRRPTEGRLTDGVGATPASTGAAPVTPSSAATPGRSPDAFHVTVGPIPPAIAAAMNGVSWRPGCPVPVSGLRLVQLTFWGFDNALHQGKLVVHADVAQAIVRIFRKLYAARFPIRKMRLIDAYGGSDDRSMADDNTSMFNCRNA